MLNNSAKWLAHVSGTSRNVQPTDVAMLCKLRLEDNIAVQWACVFSDVD